jgi:hypothetical protein
MMMLTQQQQQQHVSLHTYLHKCLTYGDVPTYIHNVHTYLHLGDVEMLRAWIGIVIGIAVGPGPVQI